MSGGHPAPADTGVPMPSKPKLHQPTAADVAALIAGIKPPERAVPMCMRGDLQADYEVLEAELAAALVLASGDRMGDSPEVADCKARMEVLAGEIKAATLTFRLRGLAQPEHLAIEAAHPAREGNERDKERGFDVEAVEKAIVRAACVFPALTAEQWDVLDATFTIWQKSMLAGAAYSASLREPTVSF